MNEIQKQQNRDVEDTIARIKREFDEAGRSRHLAVVDAWNIIRCMDGMQTLYLRKRIGAHFSFSHVTIFYILNAYKRLMQDLPDDGKTNGYYRTLKKALSDEECK